MKLKMKLITKIGLSPFTPRWLKILCLQLTLREIGSEFKNVLAKAELSKITPQQREKINSMIEDMHKSRGRRT